MCFGLQGPISGERRHPRAPRGAYFEHLSNTSSTQVLDCSNTSSCQSNSRPYPGNPGLTLKLSPCTMSLPCLIQIASGCTLVSVLLHGPTSYDCPRTDSSPRPATFQLRYNDVHVRVWFVTLPRCPVDNPAFHSAPIRIPSQPSCPQLPRKLHVLTSPVVLAFISCMLYIARSVFSWRCPISPDTGRRVTHGAAPCTVMQCSADAP